MIQRTMKSQRQKQLRGIKDEVKIIISCKTNETLFVLFEPKKKKTLAMFVKRTKAASAARDQNSE